MRESIAAREVSAGREDERKGEGPEGQLVGVEDTPRDRQQRLELAKSKQQRFNQRFHRLVSVATLRLLVGVWNSCWE